MTVELVNVTREALLAHRDDLLRQIPDLDDLRRRADEHAVTPDERDLMIELEEVEFLLGDDG